jgi:hypothetical protein
MKKLIHTILAFVLIIGLSSFKDTCESLLDSDVESAYSTYYTGNDECRSYYEFRSYCNYENTARLESQLNEAYDNYRRCDAARG